MMNWIAVASKSHVEKGQQLGIMQVCHGKKAPLQRLHADDWVVYYSPTVTFGGKDKCQSFTAIGKVKTGEPYQIDMGNGFFPFRRDVFWYESQDASIIPLLSQLDFTKDRKNWGYSFRFGLFKISDSDLHCISHAMKIILKNEEN